MNQRSTLSIAILGSTRGSTLQYLIDAIEQHQLNASIKLVISNKANAYILQRAEKHQLKTLFVDPSTLTRQQYDQQLSHILKQHAIELIVLIGYMRILSPLFVEQWSDRIINVHPSLLPRHAGLLGNAVHQAVLDTKNAISGCTIHYVNEQVDAGPIIVQKQCLVEPQETIESLKTKVQVMEGPAYIEAIEILHRQITQEKASQKNEEKPS